LNNYLRKWFFKEPWFEKFVEPNMVLLWYHSEEPFSVPDGQMWLTLGAYGAEEDTLHGG